MRQNRITSGFWIVSLLTVFLGLSACAAKTTPPGANIIFGNLTMSEGFGGSYTLLQWKEGLSIFLVDDSQGAHESSGSGSTENPVWRGQGSISSEAGQSITWRVETTDGVTAQFYINEKPYDLTHGKLFLIRANSNSPQISQHLSSHTGFCSDDENCQKLLKQDPAVLQFLQETLQLSGLASPTGTPQQPEPVTPVSTGAGEGLIPAGWSTYTSQRCEFSISHPVEIEVTQQNPYSQILAFNLANPDEGARNFIYVSVITPEIQSMVRQGVYDHEVYNYDPAELEALLNMQVGERKAVREFANVTSGFTYERKPDTQISGYNAYTYNNIQPWEFPLGTQEIRYYLSQNECAYLIGGYVVPTASNQPGEITEDLFLQIIGTVQLMP